MDWNSLKVFLAIQQNGSLLAAAKALEVNHSTVFRRLNSLEEQLGVRLFERLNNQYQLTLSGEEILPMAQRIANAFDSLERQVIGQDFQPKGTVVITAPENIACRFLPRYLVNFKINYPDISIELLSSNQQVDMNSRQADIALRAVESPPEHLVGRRVSRIPWSVFGSADYQKKHGFPTDLPSLKQHLLIGGSGAINQLPAFQWLDKQHRDQVVVRCDKLTTMSYLAQSGQGLALLPNDQQRPEIIKLFSLPQGKTSDLWLLTHPDLRNVVKVKLVMQYLAEVLMQESAFNE